MVFVPHIAHAAMAKRPQRQPGGPAKRPCGNWGVAMLVAVLGAALGPFSAGLLGGIHGDMAAALVILVLGCAGIGFAVGRAIGR